MIRNALVITALLLFTASTFCQDAKLNEDLSLKYLVQLPAGKPEHAPVIILLHGRGGNEAEFFEVRNSLPKNYLVVAARAPYHIGEGAYQWFDGKMIAGELVPDAWQVEKSRAAIDKFITEIINKYKADPKQVYLIGFSQGARMCYEVGLTAPDKLNGIGVLSGMMFEPLKRLIKITAELKKLKIFIAHGTADERIKFADAEAACNYLKSIGLNPEFHTYTGMHHQITDDELNDLVKWLKE